MTTRNLHERLYEIEAKIIDWKRRAKEYEKKRLPVPAHIDAMLDELRADARLIRSQLEPQNALPNS